MNYPFTHTLNYNPVENLITIETNGFFCCYWSPVDHSLEGGLQKEAEGVSPSDTAVVTAGAHLVWTFHLIWVTRMLTICSRLQPSEITCSDVAKEERGGFRLASWNRKWVTMCQSVKCDTHPGRLMYLCCVYRLYNSSGVFSFVSLWTALDLSLPFNKTNTNTRCNPIVIRGNKNHHLM